MRSIRLTSLVLALSLIGCAGPQKPRPAPAPAGTQPTDLLPFVGFMEDSDSNGYRDTMVLTLLMFARNHAETSIYAEGTLDLKLVAKNGKVIREWKVPPDVVAGLAKKMPAGPTYFIRLSLLDDPAGDKTDENLADLQIAFSQGDGPPIRTTATGITVGRIGR
ncbi:MAG: hypothetical protein DYG92_01600 [Leptolyngbya sp. PLA1]|nr:hypothetical protein [Leptolyngbya sp. PLA1]